MELVLLIVCIYLFTGAIEAVVGCYIDMWYGRQEALRAKGSTPPTPPRHAEITGRARIISDINDANQTCELK